VGAGMGAAFGASAPPGGIGMTPAERFGELARGTVYSIAAGSAASAIGSGRVMARQVAVDAFGNALGNGLAEMSGRGSTSGLQAASGGFPLYADSSGRFEPVIVTGTRLGDDDEVKLYYGDRLIQSFFANTPAGRAATGLGDGPRQPSSSAVGISTVADPERRSMSIDRPATYLPGRGAGARLSQMYDVNVRRDPTRSVLAQPTGDEAGDRAIRELRLRQQALLAPPIDPTIDLPLIAAGPAVRAARWLGRTALGSAETLSARVLAPRELGNAGNVLLGVDRAQVLANIAESQAARASSNFGQFVKNEGQVQANLGIWPPNSGGYAPTYGTMLDVGTKLDRFGYPGGTFVSPLGTSFESRALPPSYLKTKPYFQYEVVQPIPGVTEAKALPWFGQPGMGTQFQLPNPVQYYLENGSLKVIKQ